MTVESAGTNVGLLTRSSLEAGMNNPRNHGQLGLTLDLHLLSLLGVDLDTGEVASPLPVDLLANARPDLRLPQHLNIAFSTGCHDFLF